MVTPVSKSIFPPCIKIRRIILDMVSGSTDVKAYLFLIDFIPFLSESRQKRVTTNANFHRATCLWSMYGMRETNLQEINQWQVQSSLWLNWNVSKSTAGYHLGQFGCFYFTMRCFISKFKNNFIFISFSPSLHCCRYCHYYCYYWHCDDWITHMHCQFQLSSLPGTGYFTVSSGAQELYPFRWSFSAVITVLACMCQSRFVPWQWI